MRRCRLGLLAIFTLTATVSAQDRVAQERGPSSEPTTLTADGVVTRLMAFDRDTDGRIAPSELIDRMQPLLTRGDANADGALDETEIRTLARTPLARSTPQIAGFGNTYSFGDDIGLSSRSHIEGAIEDLRLSNLHREPALKVATEFMDALEEAAANDLLAELEGVVSEQQLAQVRSSLEEPSTVAPQFIVMVRCTAAPGCASPNPGSTIQTLLIRAVGSGQRVAMHALQVGHEDEASAAVERYQTRLRLSDADRTKLLADLKGILSEEDRDNFRAAIERRPVVAAGGGLLSKIARPFTFRHAVSAVIE